MGMGWIWFPGRFSGFAVGPLWFGFLLFGVWVGFRVRSSAITRMLTLLGGFGWVGGGLFPSLPLWLFTSMGPVLGRGRFFFIDGMSGIGF
jgi:hypothetical protein